MQEPLRLCYGCGEKLPIARFPKRKSKNRYGQPARRCDVCSYLRTDDPDIRGSTHRDPGLERLRAERIPELLAAVADELDTPDPTNAEIVSILRKRLGPALIEMLATAELTADPRAINAAITALKYFEEHSNEGTGASWLLDSPAGATDSE